jgi:hypothetical protein
MNNGCFSGVSLVLGHELGADQLKGQADTRREQEQRNRSVDIAEGPSIRAMIML